MSDKTTQHKSSPQADDEHKTFSPLAKRFLWADSSTSVERVIFWLGILCVVLFVLDFIIHRHTYVPGEGFPGFYAFVGFIAFTVIVLGATQLRRLILRNENYYAPYSVDAEDYPEQGLNKLLHGEQEVADIDGTDIDGTNIDGTNINSAESDPRAGKSL